MSDAHASVSAPAEAARRPRPGDAPRLQPPAAGRPQARPEGEEHPRGALLISLLYVTLLGLLWGYMYLHNVKAG